MKKGQKIIIGIIVLIIIIIIYYAFFSEDAKKKQLIKKIQENTSTSGIDLFYGKDPMSYSLDDLQNLFLVSQGRYSVNNSVERASNNIQQYSECVKHIFQDSYKQITYTLRILGINCNAPSIPSAIKFIDEFMNVHIKQGIVNTPQQIRQELMARFNSIYPDLKLSITIQ